MASKKLNLNYMKRVLDDATWNREVKEAGGKQLVSASLPTPH